MLIDMPIKLNANTPFFDDSVIKRNRSFAIVYDS